MNYEIEIQCVDKNPVSVENEIPYANIKARYLFWVSQIINEPNHYKSVRVRDESGELVYSHINKISAPQKEA